MAGVEACVTGMLGEGVSGKGEMATLESAQVLNSYTQKMPEKSLCENSVAFSVS